MKYQPIIGLEIHAELKTESKMFCSCKNDSLEKRPNFNICPICLGHPGTLPVINKKAVDYVIKAGLSLNCKILRFCKFDRKNYFYPDLPKGYQISQYDLPLCENGYLKVCGKKIRIRRIHLEEDTGKLIHLENQNYSLIDFNRAGVPLMELVTEPDIRSPKEAKEFAKELQLILRYLEISDADMEKGQMRVEANVSLISANEARISLIKSKKISDIRAKFAQISEFSKLGTKVEIKNLNSFKAVERALEYEIQRQTDILDSGEKVIQETRGWDDKRQKTISQRKKEEAHDYRYFPEPDLPPLRFSEKYIKKIALEIPELPSQKRKRFKKEYNLPERDIEILVRNKELANYFENVVSEIPLTEEFEKNIPVNKLYKLTANYLITEVLRISEDSDIPYFVLPKRITPENFAEFIVLVYKGAVSSTGASRLLKEMFITGDDPTHIIQEKDLSQLSDRTQLEEIVKKVIEDNLQAVKDYKKGKQNALQFLIGQTMKETKGKANPQIVKEILEEKLRK